MTTPSSGGSGFDNPQAGQGGADAVPDTPDNTAPGAEHGERRKGERGPAPRAGVGGAPSKIIWIIGLLVVVAAIAYFAGLFR